MYTIQAFIPKEYGDNSVAEHLHTLGAKHVETNCEVNAYYNEHRGGVDKIENVRDIVEYVNECGGVIRVDEVYYQNFKPQHHLEIAYEDGMLNPSDGVYLNE